MCVMTWTNIIFPIQIFSVCSTSRKKAILDNNQDVLNKKLTLDTTLEQYMTIMLVLDNHQYMGQDHI